MLHFVTGRAGTGKTSLIREAVAREIAGTSRDVVILVPEQQTVMWETAMARTLPASANLRLEITNFTRLANAVFREYGGLADPVVDEGTRMLLVWRAMLAVWDEMTVYNGGSGSDAGPGSVRSASGRGREDRNLPALTEAVDELKAAGITPAEAEAALERLTEMTARTDREDGTAEDPAGGKSSGGDLVSRLRDAVLVYAAYEDLLHQEGIDRGDLPARLGDTLAAHPYFRGKAVFVDSFYSLTAPQERILGEIFRQADECWVSFACPPPVPGFRVTDGDEAQFGEIREFYKTAVRLADRAGKERELIPLTENLRHRNAPLLKRIERDLFRYAAPEPSDEEEEAICPDDGSVRILRCADLWDEAEACASVIDRLLREGYACREIAVVARSFGSREGITDAALRSHGIPCFLSEFSDVSRSPAVRFAEAALFVGANGWQRRDVIRLVKTGLTPASDPSGEDGRTFDAEAFESYTAAWNIRGRRMFAGDDWTMNPAGYKTEITEAGRAVLDGANRVRRRLVPPLVRFLSLFDGGAAPVREIAEGLVLLAEEYGAADRLDALAGTYREIGMPKEALRAEASWDAVCRILDRMVASLGDTLLDAGRFAGLFGRVAASMDAGTIPTGCDEVVLGSAGSVRFDEVRCVILLGAVEGEFPGTSVSAGDFFDDRDKLALEAAGLVIGGPDASMQAARELFMFYRAAASAGEKLVLTAPAGPGGKEKPLSEGALRIRAIAEKAGVRPLRVFGEMPLEETVFCPETAEYFLSRRTSAHEKAVLSRLTETRGRADVPLTAALDRISPRMRENGSRMRLSQSKLDTFLTCPFLYACRYRMKLAEEPRAEISAGDVGEFVHHVLERYFTAYSPDLGEEEMREAAHGIITDYIAGLSRMTRDGRDGRDGRLVYLFRRLERHTLVFLRAVSEELRQGGFRAAACEMKIGLGEGSAEPIRIRTPDGAEVTLDGIADRVDVWDAPDGKQYIRIVDYKTGTRAFSMEKVRRGLDVQVLLYLFSVWKYGLPEQTRDADGPEAGGRTQPERIPAGAVYFSVKPAPVRTAAMKTEREAREEAEKNLVRSGIYLDDEEVLRAMDRDLSGKYVPVKAAKDGGITGRGGTTLLTLDQFGELYGEIETVIGRIAGEMRSGAAEAKPRRTAAADPCSYCGNRFVCRHAEA
jgi:ATP-dependent helicase/nuclease subunit B